MQYTIIAVQLYKCQFQLLSTRLPSKLINIPAAHNCEVIETYSGD